MNKNVFIVLIKILRPMEKLLEYAFCTFAHLNEVLSRATICKVKRWNETKSTMNYELLLCNLLKIAIKLIKSLRPPLTNNNEISKPEQNMLDSVMGSFTVSVITSKICFGMFDESVSGKLLGTLFQVVKMASQSASPNALWDLNQVNMQDGPKT